MGNGSDTMGEANRLPEGWEWTRETSLGCDVLHRHAVANPGNRFIASAYQSGAWRAYKSDDPVEDYLPIAQGTATARPGEEGCAARRAAEAALWQVDGYGRGEVRGAHLPAIEPYTKGPTALPGLAGLWTVTRWVLSPTGSGVEVDARKVGEDVGEPADPEVSVHVEVVRNVRAFPLRRVGPAPVASEATDELARLLPALSKRVATVRERIPGDTESGWAAHHVARAAEVLALERTEALALLGDCASLGLVDGLKRSRYVAMSEADDKCEALTARVVTLEASCDRLRKRESDNIDAAGLADLYRALEEDNHHTAAAMVQRLANTVARVAELEAERARFVTLLADANTWWSAHNELATTAKDPGDARYQEGKAHGILHCLTAIEAALSGKVTATAAPTGHAVAGLLARVKRAWDGAKNESEAHPNRERATYCDGTAHGLKEAHRMIREVLGTTVTPTDRIVAEVLAMPVETGEPIDFANDIHRETGKVGAAGGETRENFTRIAALAIQGALACGAVKVGDHE